MSADFMQTIKFRADLIALLSTIALSASALFSSASAASSPAQAVFDETVYYLATQYSGFSAVNLRELPAQYQFKLSAACTDLANTCPAERAYPIVTEMVAALQDKHTGFYAKGAESIREQLSGRGQTTGFGIRPSRVGTSYYVRSVQTGSPASDAGVGRGDKILAIDGQPMPAESSAAYALWDEAENRKTPSLLSLTRQGSRVSVEIAPVTLEPELPSLQVRSDGIALLRVPDFVGRGTGTVGPRIHALILEAQQKNARALIVDLRDNPGGLVTESFSGAAALIASQPAQKLVSRSPASNAEFRWNDGAVIQRAFGVDRRLFAVGTPAKWDKPVTVLVNSHSASCAEFFAINILQAGRGAVIGEPTYGVGNTVVSLSFLSDGSALQVTTARTVTADNAPYPERVTPTQVVSDSLETINRTGEDAVLGAALESLK
jgi:carboxyl-terminal processing protease